MLISINNVIFKETSKFKEHKKNYLVLVKNLWK